MSAVRDKDNDNSVNADGLVCHRYKQAIKIPSYLIAVVVGDLESRWGDPSENYI